jgi:hypothetical protein
MLKSTETAPRYSVRPVQDLSTEAYCIWDAQNGNMLPAFYVVQDDANKVADRLNAAHTHEQADA